MSRTIRQSTANLISVHRSSFARRRNRTGRNFIWRGPHLPSMSGQDGARGPGPSSFITSSNLAVPKSTAEDPVTKRRPEYLRRKADSDSSHPTYNPLVVVSIPDASTDGPTKSPLIYRVKTIKQMSQATGLGNIAQRFDLVWVQGGYCRPPPPGQPAACAAYRCQQHENHAHDPDCCECDSKHLEGHTTHARRA